MVGCGRFRSRFCLYALQKLHITSFRISTVFAFNNIIIREWNLANKHKMNISLIYVANWNSIGNLFEQVNLIAYFVGTHHIAYEKHFYIYYFSFKIKKKILTTMHRVSHLRIARAREELRRGWGLEWGNIYISHQPQTFDRRTVQSLVENYKKIVFDGDNPGRGSL